MPFNSLPLHVPRSYEPRHVCQLSYFFLFSVLPNFQYDESGTDTSIGSGGVTGTGIGTGPCSSMGTGTGISSALVLVRYWYWYCFGTMR